MIVHDTIRLNTHTFSPTMMFGGNHGYELAQRLNQASGVTNFTPPAQFGRSILEEYINDQHVAVKAVVPSFLQNQFTTTYQGQFKVLETWEDFSDVPPAMQIALSLMPEIRSGIMSGRFSGYGFDPSFYPEEDVFGRLIDNGRGDLQPDGTFECVAVWKTDDPDLTEENLDDLERSRETLRRMMREDPDVDPTAPEQTVEQPWLS